MVGAADVAPLLALVLDEVLEVAEVLLHRVVRDDLLDPVVHAHVLDRREQRVGERRGVEYRYPRRRVTRDPAEPAVLVVRRTLAEEGRQRGRNRRQAERIGLVWVA